MVLCCSFLLDYDNLPQPDTSILEGVSDMKTPITRRQALTTGAVAVSTQFSGACTSGSQEEEAGTGPGREPYWGPGKDMGIAQALSPGMTPVRLGTMLRPKMLVEYSGRVDELAAYCRKNGYTAVIMIGESLMVMSNDERDELTGALKQHDIVISAITGNRYTNFIHPDTSIRQQYLANLAKFLELADSVNCRAIPTICGTCAPETPDGVTFQELFRKEYRYNMHPDNWSLKTWKLLVASIKQVLRDTAGMKAAIAMEAQVTTTIDGPLSHKRLIDDVGDPRLGVELDPVNMISLHNYYYTTELLNECFDLLGESILTCHAKDTIIWPKTQTVHVQEVCPGRGIMDYETYFVRMSQLEWPRMLLPEHIPADQHPEAYAYLRKMAAKSGVSLYGEG